ncbi:UNKNOWN [Stylonychia lemnae]|uniref:Transmembrane protein n=1 Tax=Stylonychia lemnae TaxID=5949 RepID=A0A078AX43_STYLE|nr:UNKNOWN [Stylonychia lemnae]|eukprot:CDW85822.1 UNKNOWN [Stylonychia lemnae]
MQTLPVISNFFSPTQKTPLIIKGGAIFLENTTFNDSAGSNFSYNSALEGGVIYCKDSSKITVRNSTAYSLGGFIYQNSTDLTLPKPQPDDDYNKDSSSITFDYLYPFIKILDKSMIRYTYATQHGGSYYIQANYSEIYIQGQVNQSDSQTIVSGSHGGIMRIIQADKLFISDSYFQLYSSTNGSVVAANCPRLSVFIRNNQFDQNKKFFAIVAASLFTGDLTTGAIAIESSRKFMTQNNTYQNHFYPREGGVIYSISNTFEDFNSTYLYNMGVHGGVMKFLNNLNIKISNSTFKHNRAYGYGGAIYLHNITNECNIENVSFYNHSTTSIGGVVYFIQDFTPFVVRNASVLRMRQINVTYTYGLNAAFGFFNGFNSTIIIEKSFFNMTMGSQYNAIQITRAANFIINEITAYNFFSGLDSGFVYASNITEVLLFNQSTVICREPYFRQQKSNSFSIGGGSASESFNWRQMVTLQRVFSLISVQFSVFSYNKFSGCDLQGAKDAGIVSVREFSFATVDFSSEYNDITNTINGIHFHNGTKVYISNVTFSNLNCQSGLVTTSQTSVHIINSTAENIIAKDGGLLNFIKLIYLLPSAAIDTSITNTTIKNITLTGRGGVLFSDSYSLRNIKLQSLDISEIKTGGTGGIVHLEQYQGIFKAGSRRGYRNFKAVDFYSAIGGYFIHSQSQISRFALNNTYLQCQAEGVSKISRGLNNTEQSGVIYLADSINGLQSYNVTITRCQLPYQGPKINLINTTFIDYGSTFKLNNGSFGAVVKCNACNITMKNSIFEDNYSQFGQIFLDNQVNALFENITAVNSISQDGGVFYMTKSTQTDGQYSYVTIKNSENIFNNKAIISGGFLFIDNINLKLSLENVQASKQSADAEGGLIIVKNALEIKIQNSIFKDISSNLGGIISSESSSVSFSIKSTQFTCDSTLTDTEAIDKFNMTSPEVYTQSYFFIQNARNVSINKSSFAKCTNSQFGLFSLQKTRFYDYKSTFQLNSGFYGSIINSQETQSMLQFSQISNNMADTGGVFYIVQYSNISLEYCKINSNYAKISAGVLYLSTLSNVHIKGSDISQNQATENSAIEILSSNTNMNITIVNSFINDNFAQRNTISLTQASVLIENTQFKNNIAFQRSKNIICSFSNITIKDSIFQSNEDQSSNLMNKEITGSFIFLIFDVIIQIENSKFNGGSSNLGGAIYVSGDSTVRIYKSDFLNNFSRIKGGAIYASTFKSIYIGQSSTFSNNQAQNSGDDIFVTNSYNLVTFDYVSIINGLAKQSIFIEQAQVYANNLIIQNVGQNQFSQQGAGIYCAQCFSIQIQNSNFKNLKSSSGGAIYITESEFNKDSSSSISKSKYQIINSTFDSCLAQIGGAIYASNPESLVISGSNFLYNRATKFQKKQLQLELAGSGGALYLTCNSQVLNCLFMFQESNKFTGNLASVRGGSIYWDELEPIYQAEKMIFQGNYADQYGDDIACFAQNLGAIDKYTYKKQMIKLGVKSLDEFDYRLLNLNKDNTSIEFNQNYAIDSQRSGGEIPVLFMALIDKYGQIVGSDFKSKIRIQLQTEGLNANASKYSPIIEGSTDFIATGGIAVIQDVNVVGSPGSRYQMIFSTNGIDLNKQSNKNLLTKTNTTELDLKIAINLRQCKIGEQFTSAGKCVECLAGYSLTSQLEPGVCTQCPTSQAICLGGANIGPQPGYWRKNNQTETFVACLYQFACLGMITPNFSQVGECSTGYQGILCADCQSGFSRSNDYECAYCPPKILNIFRLTTIFIVFMTLIVFMVRSTLNGATDKTNSTSIYTKILLNHFQLLMVVASFDFEWSQQIVEFFSTTQQIATISTQVFSFDCFLNDGKEAVHIRAFLMKQIILASLPILLTLACISFWTIFKKIKQQTSTVWNKAMSSIVILLFLAHPSIVQYSFSNFKCKNIDGENRVLEDLEIVCWEQQHLFYTNFVSIPTVLIWGIGIPLFAYLILLKHRMKLENIDMRQKYGFLYRGYRTKYFYWEIVIMYRKIVIIIIAVFIGSFGVISQALLMLLILICFTMFNFKKKPFISQILNNLETLSLVTSMVTVYCGVFFIINKPQSWINQNPDYSQGAVSLSVGFQRFFFSMILIANLLFLIYWAFKFQQELRSKFRQKLTKIYLAVCLCFNKDKLQKEFKESKIKEENLKYEDTFLKFLKTIKNLGKRIKLQMNSQIIERMQIYLGDQMINKLQKLQKVTESRHGSIRVQHMPSFKMMQQKEQMEAVDQRIDEQLQRDLTIGTLQLPDAARDYSGYLSSKQIKKSKKSHLNKKNSKKNHQNQLKLESSFNSDSESQSVISSFKSKNSTIGISKQDNQNSFKSQKFHSPNITSYFTLFQSGFMDKPGKTIKMSQFKRDVTIDLSESGSEVLNQEETLMQSQNDEAISLFQDDNLEESKESTLNQIYLKSGTNLAQQQTQKWVDIENEIIQTYNDIVAEEQKSDFQLIKKVSSNKKPTRKNIGLQNIASRESINSQQKYLNSQNHGQKQVIRFNSKKQRVNSYKQDEIDINKIYLESEQTDLDHAEIEEIKDIKSEEKLDSINKLSNDQNDNVQALFTEQVNYSSIEAQSEKLEVKVIREGLTKGKKKISSINFSKRNETQSQIDENYDINLHFLNGQVESKVTDENRLQTGELIEFDDIEGNKFNNEDQ